MFLISDCDFRFTIRQNKLIFSIKKEYIKIPIPLFQRGLCDCSIKCSPP